MTSEGKVFCIQSGDGFFLEFVNDTPRLTTDPVEATRMLLAQAGDVVLRLERLGFESWMVPIRFGRMTQEEYDANP